MLIFRGVASKTSTSWPATFPYILLPPWFSTPPGMTCNIPMIVIHDISTKYVFLFCRHHIFKICFNYMSIIWMPYIIDIYSQKKTCCIPNISASESKIAFNRQGGSTGTGRRWRARCNARISKRGWLRFNPIGSMGLVHLPTFIIKNHPNVGKYTIHGSYGNGISWFPFFLVGLVIYNHPIGKDFGGCR